MQCQQIQNELMTKDRVQAVDRALSILEAFTIDQNALSLKDIAKATGYYKSTILRLIGSLEAFGYIRRDQAGLYSLGPKPWQLGNRYQQSMNIESLIRPVLKQLVIYSNENASFYIKHEDQRVCLYRENSRQAIQHTVIEGEHLPLHQGAAGKVLTAFNDTDKRSDVLKKIRVQGYYFSSGERDKYTAAIAAPVFNHTNRCLGALTVSGLRERFTKTNVSKLKLAVIQKAAQLSTSLGSSLDE